MLWYPGTGDNRQSWPLLVLRGRWTERLEAWDGSCVFREGYSHPYHCPHSSPLPPSQNLVPKGAH